MTCMRYDYSGIWDDIGCMDNLDGGISGRLGLLGLQGVNWSFGLDFVWAFRMYKLLFPSQAFIQQLDGFSTLLLEQYHRHSLMHSLGMIPWTPSSDIYTLWSGQM